MVFLNISISFDIVLLFRWLLKITQASQSNNLYLAKKRMEWDIWKKSLVFGFNIPELKVVLKDESDISENQQSTRKVRKIRLFL